MKYALFVLIGYFLGSVRFSYLIPKYFGGIDIIAASKDGNPGTANAMKYAGVPIGIACLICDLAKGALPVFIAARLSDPNSLWFSLVIAAPVLGHCFPVYHGFHGGKAVAVSFGVLIGLMGQNLIVFGLVFWYLFMCALWFVRPNEKKSVISFSLFALTSLVLALYHVLPVSFCLGIVIFSLAAVYRNALQFFVEKSTSAPKSQEPKQEHNTAVS